MLRSIAIERIKDGLGFRTGTAFDAKIVLRLQEAQLELEKGTTLPKFLLQEDQPLSLIAGNHSVALPTGFIRVEDTEKLRYLPSGSTRPRFLQRKWYIDAVESNVSEIAQEPEAPKIYVIRKATIDFVNVADANYTITWSYWKHGATLVSDVENEWLEEINGAPYWLIGEAGYRIASDMRNQTGMKLFDEMRTRGRAGCFTELLMNELADGPLQMGSDL